LDLIMKLNDRTAIVTGAARGIGRACAERLIGEGARVVLADIDDATGGEAVRALGTTSIAMSAMPGRSTG
jgi:glucose 1-dehydrogenase